MKDLTKEMHFSENRVTTANETKYTLICDTCNKEQPSHKIKKIKTACGDCCRAYNFGRYDIKYALRQVQNY